MRIHTDTLTTSDIFAAARFARVDVVKLTEHGSRKRGGAFDVKLEGESRRRPNGGSSGVAYGSGYAATWDQWGVFLAILFDVDPNATSTYYDGRADFRRKTSERFVAPLLGTGASTNYHVVNGWANHDDTVRVHRLGSDYWPADAHGDHTFRYQGVPRSQSCTKCSATMTRS